MRRSVAVFLDMDYISFLAKMFRSSIDYRKFRDLLQEEYAVQRIHTYAALMSSQEYHPLEPVLHWLGYNGYIVNRVPQRQRYEEDGARCRWNADLAMYMALDAIALTRVEEMIFAVGDQIYAPLFKHLQAQGVRIQLINCLTSKASVAHDELRRAADVEWEFTELLKEVAREQRAVASN